MSVKEIMEYSFPRQTHQEWMTKAEESLKGKSVDSLRKDTYEGILLKPLYTKEDELDSSSFPGTVERRRGLNAGGYISKPWKIAQQIDTENVEECKSRLALSFEKGQTAIAIKPNLKMIQNLSIILEEKYRRYPFCVNGGNLQNEMIQVISQLPQCETVTGYIGKDPVSLYVNERGTRENIDGIYDRLFVAMQKADSACPKLKTLLVDTSSYHNTGANAVQELAIAIATAVNHIEAFKKRGMKIEAISEKLVFHFAVGQNFFMEVAKLRAARVVIDKIIEAYGLDPRKQEYYEISAETSKFTKTIYDPYVNLLRAGNEAFAAVLGGVQYLHVSPYNEPAGSATEFSDRIARNIQLILKEEARMGTIIDPAGGSWYIESLTEELIEKSWSLFLEIDEKGGIIETVNTNWLQEQMVEVRRKRENDIFTRKQTIVGVNKYALIEDKPLPFSGEEETLFETRLSLPYEKLRKKVEKLAEKGRKPVIGLICLGKLKNHKIRAEFIGDFFAPGGVAVERSEEIETETDAIAFIRESNYSHYVICGSDQDYKRMGMGLVKKIKASCHHVKLCIAGLPDEEEQRILANNGVSRFIHEKSNCYQTLVDFLHEMEVE